MSKKLKISNPAFNQKSSSSIKKEAQDFNLVVKANTFNAVFNPQSLDKTEEKTLEQLLVENWISDSISEDQTQKDLTKLKGITAEIKSITKQGAILIGQRVLEAKELLKPYRDGTFTLWLETTFGGRKSGYNALAYYELYIALPDVELKEKFKKISQRAAYLLASRRVDIGRKINIISKYFNLKTNELISVVQKEFAINDGRNISDGRNRKTMDVLLKHLLETVDRLVKRKKDLRRKDFDEVKYAQKRIQELLKE